MASSTESKNPMTEQNESSNLEEARRNKLEQIEAMGHDPWGHRFDDRSLVGDLRKRLDEISYTLEDGTLVELPPVNEIEAEDFNFKQWLSEKGKGTMDGPKVRAAGRIMLSRGQGKLKFIVIEDWTGRIQLMVSKGKVGDANWDLVDLLDLGDIVGIDGTLRYSNTGEVSIVADQIHVLTKTLDPPPAKHIGLTDPEIRQRRRYVDLAYNEGVRDRFLNRSKIVQSIRQTLTDQGFVEIEGPTLHTVAGGAAARPFETHHNALDIPLNLRIALELHLKRLMVGGMERVFELGRVYRNEGISQKHNPEFTMMEVYQAFGNYESMMDLTEACIANAIRAISGPDASMTLPWGETEINFTTPFARRPYDDLFAENTGVDPQDAAAVKAYASSIGLDVEGKHSDVIKNEVFEEKVEDALVGPVFVIDYPASICPLTKRKRDNPAIAERFELFINGMELANAYTELNDPDLQEQLFKTQLEGMSEEDSMAKMDHDFVRALRNGMPPAGGLGIGIDRLVMLLTNSQSIRDIILFPLLRPET